MPRISNISRTRKIATLIGVLAMIGGGAALATGTSNAGESCEGLDKALQNNLNFIAGQQQNPDANSAARIDNRKAVVELLEKRRDDAGCTANVVAQKPAAGDQNKKQGSGENRQGLDKALQNNLNFIAGQQQNPDANSAARIENRKAVVELLQKRRDDAGCTGDVGAQEPAAAADAGNQNKGKGKKGNGGNNGNANQGKNVAAPAAGDGDGDVVCDGSTVTLSGEGGEAAASSNELPIGTKVKVTNLDNDQSTIVEVTSVSGSCILLNNDAFEQVREEGKNVIRNVVIEKVE
jgi:hypothetical protein